MKAIFKPEDANKLIVRDADINEASLIINYLNKISKGADLTATATYNGNYEVNGILFEITEVPEPLDTPIYIELNANVTNDLVNDGLFKIVLSPSSDKYLSYKVDEDVWTTFKEIFEELGLINISITPDGTITAQNDSGAPISATIIIPKGLLQFVNNTDSTTNNFNNSLTLALGE